MGLKRIKGGLESGADDFARAGDIRIPGMGGDHHRPRSFEDLMV
jgi:hypothetical protein